MKPWGRCQPNDNFKMDSFLTYHCCSYRQVMESKYWSSELEHYVSLNPKQAASVESRKNLCLQVGLHPEMFKDLFGFFSKVIGDLT